MATGGPLDLELTVVDIEGPLVSLELVVMVIGGALVPSEVSREGNVSLAITGLAVVVGGSLVTSDASGNCTDVLLETSWEGVGSGTGVLVLASVGAPREDDSVVSKGVEKGGCGV